MNDRRRVQGSFADCFTVALPGRQSQGGGETWVVISIRAEIAAGELIQAYFSSITHKTSYALIRSGQRILGYDNYRFWHKHPSDSPDTHQKCDEPSPESVMAEIHDVHLRLCE